MKRMLFNATYQEELRVATVDGQKLVDFDIETSSKAQRRGNIYKGIVTRVEPSLEACFVDYGTEKQGFLPFKEIDHAVLPASIRENGGLTKLSVGAEFIVQVEKDERGNKGAALTTRISLPGRYLVLMPSNAKSSGISRRIDGEERDELKTVLAGLKTPDDMSIIARTAALGRVQQELQWDLDYLLKLWDAIKTAANSNSGSFLIYQESNLVVRSIRDHFSPDITEVLIDTEEIYEQAKLFISHVIPDFANRVKLYTDDVPLFSRFQIEHQIESAYGRAVHLPSGGSIAIDMTEALTAIDVNSAKANKGSDIEATAFATNLEAAEEIARQMRLRDLGGLVVVDFIDMENSRNQREVENYFKQQLSFDRARIQMGKLSRFGLLELSRQRLQSSLEESTTIQCPRCNGVGTIRGIESNSLHILRIIQEEAVKNAKHLSALHVQLPVPVATYLLNEKRDDVTKIESRMKVRIVLIPNVHLDSPSYKIKKISVDSSDHNDKKLSFNLVDENESLEFEPQKAVATNKALVKNFAPSEKAPMVGGSMLATIVTKIASIFSKSLDKKPATISKQNVRTNDATRNNSTRNQPQRNAGGNRTKQQTSQSANPRNNNRTQPQQGSSNNIRNNNNDNIGNANPRSNNRNIRQAKTASIAPQNNPSAQNNVEKFIAQEQINKNEVPPVQINNDAHSSAAVKTVTTPVITNNNINNKDVVITKARVKSGQDLFNSTEQVTPREEKPTVTQNVVIAEPEVKKPYVPEPVDLGELQMVATDSTLLKAESKSAELFVPSKRYSDVVSEAVPVTNTNVQYEIVETTTK